jgi:hypothetical protein
MIYLVALRVVSVWWRGGGDTGEWRQWETVGPYLLYLVMYSSPSLLHGRLLLGLEVIVAVFIISRGEVPSCGVKYGKSWTTSYRWQQGRSALTHTGGTSDGGWSEHFCYYIDCRHIASHF